MVIPRRHVFVLISQDYFVKKKLQQSIIAEISAKEKGKVSTQIIFCDEIEKKEYADYLLNTSFSHRQIFVFKKAEKIEIPFASFLYSNLEKILKKNYFILDFELPNKFYLRKKKHLFFSTLFKIGVFPYFAEKKKSFYLKDYLASLKYRNLEEAFYVLDNIFKQENNDKLTGLKIVGALVNNLNGAYYENDYRKINLLWRMDRMIKEGKVDARFALEMFTVEVIS